MDFIKWLLLFILKDIKRYIILLIVVVDNIKNKHTRVLTHKGRGGNEWEGNWKIYSRNQNFNFYSSELDNL